MGRLRTQPLSPLIALAMCAACAAGAPAIPPAAELAVPGTPVTVGVSAPASLVHVQIVAFNDFHGNLEAPHGHDGSVTGPGGVRIPVGGAAYLAAYVKRLAAGNPNTVVVSAGDLTGASPLVSNLFDDEPTIRVMNDLRLDFEGAGNHDFDRGLAELTRLEHGGPRPSTGKGAVEVTPAPFEGAKFEYLAANVLGAEGQRLFAPYAIKEFGGVKIGFIGLTLEATPSVTSKEAVAGLTFTNEAATANALLPELHQKGVATTVILLHQGGFQQPDGTYDSCKGLHGDIMAVLAALDPRFRVVVSGHTHQAYDCDIDGRLVTSAGSFGQLVTSIDLALDARTGELEGVKARNIPVSHDLAPDPAVAKLVEEYKVRAKPLTDRIVGYQRGSLTRDPKTARSAACETPLGDVIADAQLAATRRAGAEIALMNPGGIRADLTTEGAATDVSPIRYGAVFETQPFGNRLVTLSLTGKQIERLLLHQFGRDRPRVLSVSKGFSYRYHVDPTTKTPSLAAASMRLGGKLVDPKKSYRVTVNSFLADGGDGFTLLSNAPDRTVGVLDVDALASFVTRETSEKRPLAPPAKLARIVGDACE